MPASAEPAMTVMTPARFFTSNQSARAAMATEGKSIDRGNGAAALAPGQNTCHAKNTARLAITPTTAAVIADSGPSR